MCIIVGCHVGVYTRHNRHGGLGRCAPPGMHMGLVCTWVVVGIDLRYSCSVVKRNCVRSPDNSRRERDIHALRARDGSAEKRVPRTALPRVRRHDVAIGRHACSFVMLVSHAGTGVQENA